MAASRPDPLPTGSDAWAHAPCMLVELDGDDRVVAVNDRYLERTGRHRHDVLGRSFWDDLLSVGSRTFYQTQLAPVLQLDGTLEEVMVELTNASGERVPALMNAIRRATRTGEGVATSLALMGVPDRRAFEDRLRHARDDAEQARRKADLARREADRARTEAERAHAATERAMEADAQARLRLELLSQASAALASSLDIKLALNRLSRVLASRLADWCLIHLRDVDLPVASRWSAAHTNPDKQADVEVLAELLLRDPRSSLHTLLAAETPSLVSELGNDEHHETDARQFRTLYSAVGGASVIGVPVTARRAQIATILLGRGSRRARFSDDDLADITDIAGRTGIVIDGLRRQAREHSNSVALQNALLTTPPADTAFEIATRYRPATNDNEIGGDWYDAFLQPDGALVLVIGDVVGHDIHAAGAMGQLRGIVRTVGYTTASTPADILTEADNTARGLGVAILASALVARLTTDAAGTTTVQWSNAGHPPGLRISQTGAHPLDGRHGRLLGLPADLQQPRHNHTQLLEPGDTLVLFTDGLVERTDASIESGIATLASAAYEARTSNVDEFCEAILETRVSNVQDDTAVIVARVPSDG